MANILHQWLLIGYTALIHPFFVSMTDINYNDKNKTLEISVRIFTDDLEKTIRQTYKGKVDLLNKNDKANSEKLVQQYINKHLIIKADGKVLNLKFDVYSPLFSPS